MPLQTPLLDRKSRICLRTICGIMKPCRGLCRQPTIRHSPQIASFSRRDATVSRTFVTRRNSDLHQIVCDFLTVRNRVGALKKSASPRTNVRGSFLAQIHAPPRRRKQILTLPPQTRAANSTSTRVANTVITIGEMRECNSLVLARNEIVVREGKGNKDRTTTLPELLKLELPDYLEKIQK